MSDKYIDQDETQIYGAWAATRIRDRVIGLLPAFDTGLGYLADEIDHATEAIGGLLRDARHATADVHAGAGEAKPALVAARELLGRFSKHLDGHAGGAIDRKLFFTTDGTVAGVGRSGSRVLLAVTNISKELKAKDTPVRDAAAWRADFAEALRELSPALDHAGSAKTNRRAMTPEVAAARDAWLAVYQAAKPGVECVLRLAGHLDWMSLVFYDLAVTSTAKVTAPPAPPPPPEPAP